MGKVKTVDYSETIAACDLKVGRCRQLIEFMKGKWENSGYLRNYCNQWPENLKVQTTNSVNEGEY